MAVVTVAGVTAATVAIAVNAAPAATNENGALLRRVV